MEIHQKEMWQLSSMPPVVPCIEYSTNFSDNQKSYCKPPFLIVCLNTLTQQDKYTLDVTVQSP